MRVTRRGVHFALAAFWFLDAALQFQPFMFTRGFGRDIIAPAGDGQPVIVSGPVHWAGDLIAAHPVLTNSVFAVVQLVIALALLWRRSIRAALAASILWSLGVWWLGEGFNGLLSGHAMLLTGAPGAVILYAALAVAAWPSAGRTGAGEPLRQVALYGWIALWGVGALYQALPGQNTGGAVSGALSDVAGDQPGSLAAVTNHAAATIGQHTVYAIALVLLQALIAGAALVPGATRVASLTGGSVLAMMFWGIGQSFGELFSGQATDPNTGPLILLFAVATASSLARSRAADTASAFPNEPEAPYRAAWLTSDTQPAGRAVSRPG